MPLINCFCAAKYLSGMKKISVTAFIALLLISFLPACIKDEDECDTTKATTLNRNIDVAVLVTEKGGNPAYNRPAEGEYVTVEFTKYPCGEDAKGYFKMEGVTDASGNFQPTIPNYNFNNTKDRIEIRVDIEYTMDNGASQVFSETYELTYDHAKQTGVNIEIDIPVVLEK